MKELEVKTWDEIQDMDFPTEEPIVDGLLYNGTYLFVGSPKIGKSFFMLDLCYHIASGTTLWGREVKTGTTLYVAREDDYKRIRKRLHIMYGIGTNEKMKFAVESEGITSGLIDQLAAFVKNNPDIQLIILDTLQKVRGNGNGADQYNYGADYEMIGKLKDFTDKQRLCIILVHHTRKMEASDPFDMISGSSGLLGAVDGAFVMYKESRTDQNAKLCVTGRDVADMELSLTKDPETLKWQCTFVNEEHRSNLRNPFLAGLSDFLTNHNNHWQGTATELCEQLPPGIKTDSANTLSRKINVLKDDLYKDFGIAVQNTRTATNRIILLDRSIDYLNKLSGKWEQLSLETDIPFGKNEAMSISGEGECELKPPNDDMTE
ncbi:MAG: helicase RepA family protein [Lachnospiraceae bacterium]|nr:helicase RepA family protein [Lachnospiraceae bacterium]